MSELMTGWLGRQLDHVKNDVQLWPEWMKREAGFNSMNIPKGNEYTPGPCWIPHIWNGKVCRPIIVCACGQRNTAAAHHIHADGRVTASYYHAKEPIPSQGWAGGGCGFHEFITLLDYDQGEFPPE